jgi:hypothetical protein
MRRIKVLSVSLPAEMLSRVETMTRTDERTVSELLKGPIRTCERLKAGAKPPRRATAKYSVNAA